MVNPNDIGDAVGGFFNNNLFSSIFVWTGYIFFGLVVLGFFYALYLIIQYKYKIKYIELKGMDLDNFKKGHTIDISGKKIKKEMARPIRVGGVDKWRLLWCRKTISPVEYEFVKEKNRLWMFRTGPNAFIPCKHNSNFVVGNHVVEQLLPMFMDVKFWEQTELQKATLDTTDKSHLRTMMIWASVVIVAILIFTAATVWFNLNAAQGAVAKIDLVAAAVNNLKGVAPG